MELQRPFRVITATIDGDVLSAVAQVHAWLTVSDLHRVIGRHSEAGVRKSVHRLSRQGILDGLTQGRTTSYRLNRAHLAAGPILELSGLADRLVERLRLAIEDWPTAPLCLMLFGSVARKEMTPESDIDIFLTRPERGYDDASWDACLGGLEESVRLWTGNPAQIVDMTESEADARLAEGEPLLEHIARDGILVTGSRPKRTKQRLRS